MILLAVLIWCASCAIAYALGGWVVSALGVEQMVRIAFALSIGGGLAGILIKVVFRDVAEHRR
jgi:hypothetical protein